MSEKKMSFLERARTLAVFESALRVRPYGMEGRKKVLEVMVMCSRHGDDILDGLAHLLISHPEFFREASPDEVSDIYELLNWPRSEGGLGL